MIAVISLFLGYTGVWFWVWETGCGLYKIGDKIYWPTHDCIENHIFGEQLNYRQYIIAL